MRAFLWHRLRRLPLGRGFSWFLAGLGLLALLGCQRDEQDRARAQYEEAWDGVSLPANLVEVDPELNILIWRDYFPEELFQAFEDIYGVKVQISYFENNEEMRQVYYEDPAKWDLLMPSDYMVSTLRREGQLDLLQKEHLPRMQEITPSLYSLECDPGLQYFVPYFYTTLGISFNVQYIGGFPRSWGFLEGQGQNPFVPGRIAFGNQPRFAMAFALMQLGKDPNTRDPEEIALARDYLIHLVEDLGAQIVGDELLENGNWNPYVLIVQWSGSATSLLSLDLNYRFLIPEGPTVVAIDGFVIPQGSSRKETTHLLLDFLMTPEVFARAVDYSFYAPSSFVAERRISHFIRLGPSLLLPKPGNLITLEDVGFAEQYYLDAWDEVLAAQPRADLQVFPLPAQ